MELKDRLKQLRIENNYLQKDIAEKLNISTSGYGYYEQGRNTPNPQMIKEIASLYNVSIDYLLGASNIKNPYDDKKDKYIPETLSAHFDGYEFSKEDLEDIKNFIEFVKQRKKNN